MSLLGILFGITMIFLIGKALLETIWGVIRVIFCLLCYTFGVALSVLAEAVEFSYV